MLSDLPASKVGALLNWWTRQKPYLIALKAKGSRRHRLTDEPVEGPEGRHHRRAAGARAATAEGAGGGGQGDEARDGERCVMSSEPWLRIMNSEWQAQIDQVRNCIRCRIQEIAPLAMVQLNRVGESGDDRLRDWLVDLARGDEQLTDLCVHLEVISRLTDGRPLLPLRTMMQAAAAHDRPGHDTMRQAERSGRAA